MASKPCKDLCFDEILQCSICMELITDPRALPCLHSYCYKCISSWCSDKKPGNQASCPLCRKDFVVPDHGIQNLPKNFFVANLLKLKQLKNAEDKPKLCDICEEVEEDGKQGDTFAVMFCLECQQRMCKSCSTYHAKLKISSSHKLVSLDEISTGGSDIYSKYHSLMCDKHPDRKIEVFCLDCKTTLCMMCYIKDHSSHKCSDVAEVAGDFRSDLNKDTQHMTTAIEKYDANLAELRQDGKRFSTKAKYVEIEICRRADQLHAEIETEKQKLVAGLQVTAANHHRKIAKITEEITQSKSLVQRSLNYCSELLQRGSAVDIAREAISLHTRAEELGKVESAAVALKDVSVVDVSFTPSVLSFNRPDSILGRVINKGVEPTISFQTQQALCRVVAIAALNDELFVIHGHINTRVSVYDSDSLQLKHHVPFHEGVFAPSPAGLATCPINKCLYVSDSRFKCVFSFDIPFIPDIRNKIFRQWSVPKKPRRLSVMSSNCNVLVAFYEEGGLAEYSPTGEPMRSWTCSAIIFYAAEVDKNTLVVSRQSGDNFMRIFTMKKVDQVMKKLEYASDSKYYTCHQGLALDSSGYVYMTDQRSNQITVLNMSKKSVRMLELPTGVSLKSPYALCYDGNKRRLYVGENDDGLIDSKAGRATSVPRAVWDGFNQNTPASPESGEFRLLAFDVIN